MGLDMYAYAGRVGQNDEYYEAEYGEDESRKGTVPQPRELAYWRKHPNLHGWMEMLWIAKGGDDTSSTFNGIELELNLHDLDELENDIACRQLPPTEGFFFGGNADEHYKETDLKFIKDARDAIANGECVFYNSSW